MSSLLFPPSNRCEYKAFLQFLLPHHQGKAWTKNKHHGYNCHYGFLILFFIWYDRVWPSISKKYNIILWTSFFLQIFDFKIWKIKTTSLKIYWDNYFLQKFSPSPALFSVDWLANYTKTMLGSNYWPITRGDSMVWERLNYQEIKRWKFVFSRH